MAFPNEEESTVKYRNLAIAVFRTSVLGVEQLRHQNNKTHHCRVRFTVARLIYHQLLLYVRPGPRPEKMVHNIRTKDEFQDALKKYPIVVVDFYSTHSAESKHIAATFAHAYELDKFKDFRFVKVDIDDLKGLAEEVGVTQPATFHMYKNGEKINDLQSEHKEDLIQFLETGL
ncbi:thioredoxin [Fusarium oxysporum f. sp. phaseoli]